MTQSALTPLASLALSLAVLVGAAPAAPVPHPVGARDVRVAAIAGEPTLAQMIGAKLIVRMNGIVPSASLLARVRRGEISGIVLFEFANISTKRALVSATSKLQAAAREGGQPPALIMVDQEGGAIRHIPWAPTSSSARAMGANGSSTFVYRKGAASGRALRASGVNVNLAPIADVALGRTGFMYLSARTFSTSSRTVSRLALQFAKGTRATKVAPTIKHFPGIGRVRLNTDRRVQTVTASRSALAGDLAPFRAAIAAEMPMIMLSNATYTAWDRTNAAGWSRAIATGLLRTELGFEGVSITDSLNGTAAARDVAARSLASKSIRAGVDMVMLTSRESATADVYDDLLARAEAGAYDLAELRASYDRIVALREAYAP